MGTLGCINDMMRRDKENRELRKRNKERLHDTRDRLLRTSKSTVPPNISAEQIEEIRQNTKNKEELDKRKLFLITMLFAILGVIAILILWIIVTIR